MRKILVQHEKTKRFLDENGAWIKNAGRARNFPTSLNAMVYCAQKDLGAVHLVVRIDGPDSRDIVVKPEVDRVRMNGIFASRPRAER